MHHRRRLAVLAAVIAAACAFATGALAASHPRHVSGRVVSIDVRRHTLRLRVKNAARARAADASGGFQAAGGSLLTVSFGDATVTGPDGAVAVGDEVNVTTQDGSGHGAVATSIQVIGQPNGGSAGKGAAVPGVVTAVDAGNGQLTLAVTSTDGQGQSQPSSVIVTVSSATILAVAGGRGGGAVSLADIAVGDHVVVFTDDAGADPIAAIGILDASNAGADQTDGGGVPDRTEIPGTVNSVDAAGSTLVMTAGGDGPFAGQQITVKVTPDTSFGGEGDGSFGLGDIQTGDSVTVYAPAPPAGNEAVALGIVDDTSHGGGAGTQYSGVEGTVSEVGPSSLELLVTGDGPLAGQTVTVDAATGATFRGANGLGGQVSGFADIQLGDHLAVYTTTGLDPQPLEAVVIADRGEGTDPPAPPPSPPASPPATPTAERFGGIVTDVRGDGLTVDVTSGGPLSGQSVIVAVTATTSFATPQGRGTGLANLADVAVGDPVEIYTASESATPVVALGVVDDSALSGSESQDS